MCAVPLKGLQKDDLSLEQLQTLQKLIKKRIPTGAERHALHRAGGCDRHLSGGDVYRHLHARVGLLYMEGCSWSLLCLPAGLVRKRERIACRGSTTGFGKDCPGSLFVERVGGSEMMLC